MIQQLTPPKDVKGVKCFMGVVNYFFKFIPQCSIMAEPLLELTQGRRDSRVQFNWGEEQKSSFKALKAHLVLALILRFNKS